MAPPPTVRLAIASTSSMVISNKSTKPYGYGHHRLCNGDTRLHFAPPLSRPGLRHRLGLLHVRPSPRQTQRHASRTASDSRRREDHEDVGRAAPLPSRANAQQSFRFGIDKKNSGVGRVGLQRRFLSNWATIPIHSFSLSAQKVVRPTGFSHPLTPTPTSEGCFLLPRQPPPRSPTTAGHPGPSHHHPARSNKDDGVESCAEAHPALEDPPR
jgi:hypothetical protein